MKRRIYILILLFLISCAYAQDEIKFKTDPPQNIDVRYRLFETTNYWNFLELDTQTGLLWQVQFTVDTSSYRFKIPINDKPLAHEGENGRFTLYPTFNMWNYLLVDQNNGLIWQIQFSTQSNDYRFITPIFAPGDVNLLKEAVLPNKSNFKNK